MKRPLALVGFTYLLTLAVAVYLGGKLSSYFALAFVGIFLLFLMFGKANRWKSILTAIFVSAAALFIFSVYDTIAVKPVQKIADQNLKITGRICELPEKQYEKNYYVMEVTDIDTQSAPKNLKIRFSVRNGLDIEPYDKIEGTFYVYLPGENEGYSSRAYYASKGITALAYLQEYEHYTITPADKRPVFYYALMMRKYAREALFGLLPKEEAGLISGMLLGDKTSLSENASSNFREIGVSHLLAVSGLHMSIVAGAFFLFLRRIKMNRYFAASISMVVVLLFMAVVGFTPSVVRSGVMFLLYLGGILLWKKPDSFTSLGAAGLIICLFNPYAAADVGLLLSFSATLGILLFARRIQTFLEKKIAQIKYGKKLLHKICENISVTLSATFFILPITILFFGQVSFLCVLANLLLLYPCTVIISLAAVSVIVWYIPIFVYFSKILGLIIGILAKYVLWIADLLAKIPYANISVSYGFIKLWLALTLLLIAYLIFIKANRKQMKQGCIIAVILLFVGIVSYQVSNFNTVKISVIETGDAASVMISENGKTALIGSGGYRSSNMKTFLKMQNVRRLSYFQFLDYSKEEYENAKDILQTYPTDRILLQKDRKADISAAETIKEVFYYDAYACAENVLPNTKIETYAVDEKAIVRIHAQDITILICPPNLKIDALPDAFRSCDILISSGIPEAGDWVFANYSIFATSKKQENFQMGENFGYIAKTSDTGNIILNIKDGNVTFGRES